MVCEHLEVSEFGSYSVQFDGVQQVVSLQKCNKCGKYLTFEGVEIPHDRIVSIEVSQRERMRTVTATLDAEMYDRLLHLARSETGQDNISKIMNEVVALGLEQYRRQLIAA
jgi:CO/xanthine dehydrogenase Mo-binding subunit